MAYPDYFQKTDEDALKSQVKWAKAHLEIDDDFYCELLQWPVEAFREWTMSNGYLPSNKRSLLTKFWKLLLHLLTHFDYNESDLKDAFNSKFQCDDQQRALSITPPWAGNTLRDDIAQGQEKSIEQVYFWIDSIRSGNAYQKELYTV